MGRTGTLLVASAAVLALTAAAPAAGAPVTSIAAGYYHTCALLTSNVVKCWGSNEAAQFGDGTTKSRHSPSQGSPARSRWAPAASTPARS